MFSRLAQHSLFVLLALPILAQAHPAPGRQEQSGKLSIIIDHQLVRFVAPGEALEWRLEVVNQQGEVIFDSSLVNGSALEWPLSNQQGEAVTSGLYTYTLSIKEPTGDTPRLQRGHIIVDRPSTAERIWVTSEQRASLGATSTAVKLTVVGGELAVGGAEFLGAAPRREASAADSTAPQRANTEETAEKASVTKVANGTANRVAKFAADGTSLIDSALSEVGGNVGIGTNSPQSGLDYRHGLAPFFTRDIGTTNFGTAQSALQLGVSNLGARNAGVGPSMLFFGENSAGNKAFLGRVSAVWENPTAGAEAGAIFFQTRANSGDVSALSERMRITAAGNVGIGTTNPDAKLSITATGDGARVLHLGTERAWVFKQLGTGAATALELTGAVPSNNNKHFVINTDGNVGIGTGTTTPQAKLDVRGDAVQSRGSGGFAKAMIFVNEDGTINRCYNSQATGGAVFTPPCGFSIEKNNTSGHITYIIDFGFKISDRFYSVTPNHEFGYQNQSAKTFSYLSQNQLGVTIYNNSTTGTSSSFTVIIF
jgi:hypothetical protein